MNIRYSHFVLALLVAAAATASTPSFAYKKRGILQNVEGLIADVENTQSFSVPAKGRLEVAFSPNEGSEHLVIKVIDSATKELSILAYSFTSAPITAALLRAVKRGVTVRLVADYKSNVAEDKSGKARAALSALATAGADVRTIRVYPIHHDKLIIADRQTLEQGSFNFSAAAASRNSEQVLVNWDNPELAQVYQKHFERNYRQSEVYSTRY